MGIVLHWRILSVARLLMHDIVVYMVIKNFSVIIEQDKHGFVAECLDLQGCYTQGKTYEEVIENIKDAIKLHIQDSFKKKDKVIIPERSFSLSNLQIAIA